MQTPSRASRSDRRELICRDNTDRQSRECGIETFAEVCAKTGWLHASLDFKLQIAYPRFLPAAPAPKTASKGLQNLCAFAPLRLCVESLLHGHG
jgi:hypothetical protein